MEDWRAVMEPQLRKLLTRPGVEVWVACHPGEEDHRSDLYGWIAVERGHRQPLVLYVYVKQAYRRQGLARGLFAAVGIDPAAPFSYAAKTSAVRDLRSKIPLSRWEPLIARFPPKAKPDEE
jgi:GNAT superfamily N-acetyltransferase